MAQSPAVIRRRGGKGLYRPPANGLRNPGAKGKPKKLTEYLEPDELVDLSEQVGGPLFT